MDAAKQYARYEDILNADDRVIAEIINGQLYTHPRPSPKHSKAQSSLGIELGGPFQKGSAGGPGGWIFLVEPELWLSPESGPRGNYLVPDIAAWKRERFLYDESKNGIEVAPDWVCEILSPATASHDRINKMPVYARFGISYIWLIDPGLQTLEVYRLFERKWLVEDSFKENDKVKAPPFEAIEFDLSVLWL